MSAATIKARFVDGQRVRITNHYISRPDHPCYGTREDVVSTPNSSSVGLGNLPGMEPHRVPWPKAADLDLDGDTVQFRGHPSAGDLFLTIELLP